MCGVRYHILGCLSTLLRIPAVATASTEHPEQDGYIVRYAADLLVLLNAKAVAAGHSVANLLGRLGHRVGAFGVMLALVTIARALLLSIRHGSTEEERGEEFHDG